MNSYTLSAESRRWWMPSAAAGVAAASAIAVITMVPISTYAASSEPRDRGPAASAPAASDHTKYRSCFMIRPNWNPALEGPQPRCVVRAGDDDRIQPQAEATGRGPRRLETGV